MGLEVPGTTLADEEVSITAFASSLVAEVDIAGPSDVELGALDWLYLMWLPEQRLRIGRQAMFEAWNGRTFAHGMEHFELRVQLRS